MKAKAFAHAATILAAQSTDKTINTITPALFARYPDPASLAAADPDELEPMIYKSGFFRMKARSLLGMARMIVERHEGRVPETMAELVELPGVARKTANVVLGCALDKQEGIVHPLYQRARDACDALLDELKAAGHFPVSDDETLGEFVGQYMTLTAKLAGATGGLAYDSARDDGALAIAWLKRTLEIHNAALAAATAMDGSPFLPPTRLAHHRAGLFALREATLTLITRLRSEG